ncbi:hypothetical protein CAPTEDRAFT_115224, partial [Capitella teleta]
NYRPISITCETCKVLEKKSTLTEYLESNNLIHNAQHGFCPGRSCTLTKNTGLMIGK